MALWGNTDLVYDAGTIEVDFATKTVYGPVGVVTFTDAVGEGDVITVGAGATYGYAAIVGVGSTALTLASTAGFTTTVIPAGTAYYISQEPSYTILDSTYRAPEEKTVGYSTSPVTTAVYGVDAIEVGAASTTEYAVGHSGWVGVTTYIDMHGELRVKHEVLVAGGILTTTDNDADDGYFPGT